MYSYTIFTYKCGLMEWDNGATIGFNAAGDPYANHDPSTADVACLNMMYTNWSNVEYLLSDENPETPAPQDVTVTNITTVEAVVSWIIPRFTTPEMYYIQYGYEENVLDMTTTSVSSPTDTSLVNQTYSIMLQGLSDGTMYFLRVVAVYDDIADRFSDLTSFRTYEEEQVVYLPFLNHGNTNIDSGRLDQCDNCSSVEILFPDNLPFGGYFHQSAYVGSDGLISFGQKAENLSPTLFPSTVPEIYWSYILAPFWANLDSTENGRVSWELHNIEQSPMLLDQVNMFIQTLDGVNFTGTWMLVAFWEDVDIYDNTFQAIVITDGINSYSVYTYKCGELAWPTHAIIGFNAPLMDYANDPFSGNGANSIACTHLISPWNNIVYDLQPGTVILPTTPEPSSFIGSCVDAGYTECCEGFDCEGSPDDCFCDSLCFTLEDCCYDFLDICPDTTAPLPYDILVAVGPSLATVHYQGSDSSILRTNFSESILAVDFNYENSKVYWSHTDPDYGVPATIYCANLNGSEEQVLVDTNILYVSDIAMDWIAGHLYWVDSSWARIEAMDLDNLNRTEVIRTGPNTNPSAIAVDPLRRYMFWSDLGVTSQIERAFMDGLDRRVIVNTEIVRPVGITIDYSEQRIYWSDADLHRIEYCDYNGFNRFSVETETSGLLYPFALTVANNLLFWTDSVTDSLYATHKEHGSDNDNGYFQTVATFSSDPYGIEALLENRQEQGQNPCEDSTCSHICLLSARGYVCVCPEGYQLEPDKVTCKVVNNSGISPPAEGSCAAGGYTSCCTHGYCTGYPPTCSCHPDCTLGTFGCCSDFEEMCPPVPPLQPVDVTATNLYATSAQIEWTVRRTPFGFETYSIEYGPIPDSLNMQSDVIAGVLDSSFENVTYSLIIEDLQPLTMYYYRVVATNIAGVTVSGVENFTTPALMTSSVTVESTVSSLPMPTTTVTEQPTQGLTAAQSSSPLASVTVVQSSTNIGTSAVETGVPTFTYGSMQTTAYTSTSVQMTASTYSSMQISTTGGVRPTVRASTSAGSSIPEATGSVRPTVRTSTSVSTSAASTSGSIPVPTRSSTTATSMSQTMRPTTTASVSTSVGASSVQQTTSATSAAIQEPSSSLLATATISSLQQTLSASIPSLANTMTPSQTTLSVGATTASEAISISSPTTTMLPPSTTSSHTPTQPSTPTGVPIETKLPTAIEENRVKITLAEYDEKSFDASVQQRFKLATAEVVTEYCARELCPTIKIKRSASVVESDDVIITEIYDTSMGVSVVIYVIMNEDEILDGNILLSSIQNGSAIYNFNAVTAEKITAEDTGKSSEGLTGGAIAGIVIGVLIVVAAVVATDACILYHIRKRGLYKVTGLVGGFDEPMTDKFFEFGHDNKEGVVKENPGYEEKEL